MSLIRNSGIVVAGAFIANVLAYIFNIYVARLLGPSSYGILGSLLALFYIASMIYGPILSVVTKEIAHLNAENKKDIFSLFFKSIKKEIIFLLTGALFIFVVCSNFLSSYLKTESAFLVILTGLLIFSNGLMNFNLTVLTGFKKYTIISKSKIFEAAIRLIFALILLNFGWGLNGVLLSYGLGYFIVFIWTQKFISPNILSTKEASYSLDRKSIYSMALKFFFAGLFFQIAINISSIYVQHYYSSTINGYWTAGMNISRITLLFTDAVNQVLFPELIGERNNNIRTGFIKRSLMIILLITGLSSIVCWMMPDFIINLIYGPAYIHASLFLKWQSLFMILISLIQLYYTVYFSKINYSENNKMNKEISI